MQILDSLRNVAATLIDMIRTRVELLGIEVQEEIARQLDCFYLTVMALLLGTLALAFAGVAVIMIAGEAHRGIAASLVAVAFALAALSAWASRRQARAATPALFADSLNELARDRDALRTRRPEASSSR